jgi:hypothetical protein
MQTMLFERGTSHLVKQDPYHSTALISEVAWRIMR